MSDEQEDANRTDPLDGLEMPTLAERIEPYRRYGDTELALSLWHFEKCNGGPGISAPAAAGFDYHCPDCEENVRGVTKPNGNVVGCPLCGAEPGMLTLGRGPK